MRSVAFNCADWLVFLTILLTFFLTYLLTFFLTYLLTFFLTYLLTCFLTYLLTFFVTYQRQNIASTASRKSHSTNSIFTSHHAAKVISMTTLRLSNGNSTVAFDCIGPPRQKAVKSKDAKCLCMHIYMTCIRQPPQKTSWVPRCHASEHTAATTSHGVCKPWSQMLATVPLGPLRCNWPCSLIPTSQKDAKVQKTGARCSNSCSPSPFGTAFPSYATYHKVPSTTSGAINIQSPACVVLGGSMQT